MILTYFCQKAYEAFDQTKKYCGVVFDIMKSFDKVWYDGLLYKMSKLNIPFRLGYWIKDRHAIVPSWTVMPSGPQVLC